MISKEVFCPVMFILPIWFLNARFFILLVEISDRTELWSYKRNILLLSKQIPRLIDQYLVSRQQIYSVTKFYAYEAPRIYGPSTIRMIMIREIWKMDRIKRFGSEVAYFFRELKQQSYDLFFGEFFSVKPD